MSFIYGSVNPASVYVSVNAVHFNKGVCPAVNPSSFYAST